MDLKKYLQAKNMTPREFAEIIDVSLASVYYYLNGRRPNTMTILRIIKATDGKVTYKDMGYEVTYKAKRG